MDPNMKVRITINFRKYYGEFVNEGQIGIFEGHPIITRENFMGLGADFLFAAIEPDGKILSFNLSRVENVEFFLPTKQ